MKNKIKNIFRKLLFILALSFVVIFLFSGQAAHAATAADWITNPVGSFVDAAGRIALAIVVTAITFVLSSLQIITAAFCYMAAIIIKWVVTTPVRLTSGGVVDVGWAFCRDFANMFFIVVLLVIAYATMLKKETFGMKQALVPLILMALLINFSQVIAGVIVDISSIFMNFFIQNGAADAGQIFVQQNTFAKDIVGIGTDQFWGNFITMFNKSFPEFAGWAIGVTFKALVGVIFNVVEFLILIAYAAILVIRIVMIWILVILSPIAFICYVLPATKSFWQMWWKNFIQWATVGIILLFFLYLGGYLMAHSSDIEFFSSCKMPAASEPTTPDSIGWGASIMSEFFCSVLPSIAGLTFLLLGLFLGVSGAGGMPSFAQKIMKMPTQFVGGKAWEMTKTGAAATGRKMLGGYELKKDAMGKERLVYAPTKLGKFVGGMEKFPGVRGVMGGFGATRMKLEQAAMASSEKLLATKRTEDLETELETLKNSKLLSPAEGLKMVSISNVLGKRNKFGEYVNSIPDSARQEGFVRLIGQSGGDLDTLLRYLPRFGYLIGKTAGDMIAKMGGREYTENMRPEDIKKFFNVSEQGHIKSVLNFGPPEKIKAVSESVNDFIGSISDTKLKTGLEGAGKWADRLNPATHNRAEIDQEKAKLGELNKKIFTYLSQRANVPSGVTNINDYAAKIIEGVSHPRAV